MNNDFFSGSYLEARALFIQILTDAGARLESYRNPTSTSGNNELNIDTAYIGPPSAPNVLVLVSGTHGVEGYCGSACQIAATTLRMWKELPQDSAVLLIHALNPYGFAHGRRVNEDNVDINRNCVADFQKASNINRSYDDISDLLNPVQWSSDPPHPGFDQNSGLHKSERYSCVPIRGKCRPVPAT